MIKWCISYYRIGNNNVNSKIYVYVIKANVPVCFSLSIIIMEIFVFKYFSSSLTKDISSKCSFQWSYVLAIRYCQIIFIQCHPVLITWINHYPDPLVFLLRLNLLEIITNGICQTCVLRSLTLREKKKRNDCYSLLWYILLNCSERKVQDKEWGEKNAYSSNQYAEVSILVKWN